MARVSAARGLRFLACSLLFSLLPATPPASAEVVEFDSGRWTLRDGKVVDYLGRKSLIGGADLKDVTFENGTIEFDIAVDGKRCFPGVAFRIQNEQNLELFYIRPHKPKVSDALQYSPVFNGLTGWQLYSGRGFTAPADIPYGRWIHIKIEVTGTRARIYFDGAATPSLVIDDLKQGASKGYVGLRITPGGGAAYFSNFSVTSAPSLDFGPAPLRGATPGMLTSWQISQAFKVREINRAVNPYTSKLPDLEWRDVTGEPSGLVDISRYVTKAGPFPECVLARTTIMADRDEVRRLSFGYSDEITIFLNGAPVFSGDSTFTRRDPEFNGVVGLNDAVYLNLKKGSNELLLMVTETFGGWGFECQIGPPDGEPVALAEGVARKWEIASGLMAPESAAYDAKREMVYISNFILGAAPGAKQGFIARATAQGEVRDPKWISGLNQPSGITVSGDRAFVVERDGVAVIDIEAGKIETRHPCPANGLLNDVTVDPSGVIYVSDSRASVIYRVSGGDCESWVSGWPLSGPNGLLADGSRLVVGNMLTGQLLFFDLADRKLTAIIDLPEGTIDGIAGDGNGNYIVSQYDGRVLRVAPTGKWELLVDTTRAAIPCADLDYAPGKRLILVPTFAGNSAVAYEITAGGAWPR